ncbi:MAG: hypothetical protein U0Z26_19120 [Anaerolineales bacterium]
MQALELQSKYITKWIISFRLMYGFHQSNQQLLSNIIAHSGMFGDFQIYDTLQVDDKDIHYYVATQSYTTIFTATDSPVVSMPIGLGESGLPVNVQVVGRRYNDYRLLKVAKLLASCAEEISYPFMT